MSGAQPSAGAGQPDNARRIIPRATCRLQFNRDFAFAHAAAVAEYLGELGISDCYASPLFKAAPASTHGYDICGFDQINPALGGEHDFERFAAGLKQLGLGLLLDMVPNHMGNDLSNRWWLDVLENGPASPFANYFDIDWRPLGSELRDKVLLPTLEDHYVRVLESGKVRLGVDAGTFFIGYHDRRFPVSPQSREVILAALARITGEREPSELRERLENWHNASGEFRDAVERAVDSFNGHPGEPRSFDRLHELLQQQHYRLAYWRVGSEEMNYRRFFDIAELISVKMELSEVFDACHELVFRLLREGIVTGLRVDHPDGLWDPKAYFARLQEKAGASPERAWPLFVVAEKILSEGETLPRDWPVDGTTGYDFLNLVNGLFVNPDHRTDFDRIYHEFTGCKLDFDSVVYAAKSRMLDTSFMVELDALTHRLRRVAGASRQGQDFTFRQLRRVLRAIIAAFPVYRTYLRERAVRPTPNDAEFIRVAAREARPRTLAGDHPALDFVESMLLLEAPGARGGRVSRIRREFVMKFQQLTGPVMAKGFEDTALYNYHRLISLNEVGGNPDAFGISLEQFHERNRIRAAHWPHSLLATATHDTKRGEDVRARINVLSEMPDEWRRAVNGWRDTNAEKKSTVHGQPAPHPNDEYLLYQTLVGAWPAAIDAEEDLRSFRERIVAYMLKAIKEAKARTSWIEPDEAYESAVQRFVESVLIDGQPNRFLDTFLPFQRRVSFFGRFNSLSQTLLRLTAPGVPDLYQGTELWDFSLVDPDNRRPVDFALRRTLLKELKRRAADAGIADLIRELAVNDSLGRSKLWLIWRALEFRRERRTLFDFGDYVPLASTGAKAEHVCSFARAEGEQLAIVIVPRLVVGLTAGAEQAPLGEEIWRDTMLLPPKGPAQPSFRNALTGEHVAFVEHDGQTGLLLGDALKSFPVALLERL
jgi:(1->4)-alpha-D-glucan 1-alpha-D-glucosylmutase